MRRARHFAMLSGYLLAVLFVSPLVASAVEASTENISRSYGAEKALTPGMIVSAMSSNADYVEAANTQNSSLVIGVAVKADSSVVAVDPDNLKAQVATSGKVSALVSTVNGDIKAGDKIAPSPFSGIGMKAAGGGYIVGSALTNFNRSSEGASVQQVTDKSGGKSTITVGYIQMSVTPRYDSAADANLNGLQRLARSLTGHVISTPRVIISLLIAVLTIIAIIVLMYAGIYGTIVSIGRNPLARVSILRALTRVVAMAALAFTIAFGLIYLLLR